jgi:hypothetical protein
MRLSPVCSARATALRGQRRTADPIPDRLRVPTWLTIRLPAAIVNRDRGSWGAATTNRRSQICTICVASSNWFRGRSRITGRDGPKSEARAAPIVMTRLFRCALPSADRAGRCRTGESRAGWEPATRTRTCRVDYFPTLQPTRITPCNGSSAVGRPGGSGSGRVASGAGPQSRSNRYETVVKVIVTPLAATLNYSVAPVVWPPAMRPNHRFCLFERVPARCAHSSS